MGAAMLASAGSDAPSTRRSSVARACWVNVTKARLMRISRLRNIPCSPQPAQSRRHRRSLKPSAFDPGCVKNPLRTSALTSQADHCNCDEVNSDMSSDDAVRPIILHFEITVTVHFNSLPTEHFSRPITDTPVKCTDNGGSRSRRSTVHEAR